MSERDDAAERLFSYGTLQLEAVQLATFGRRLTGTPDALPGYAETPLPIDDPEVVRVSGKAVHTMARHTGRAVDVIAGTVFEMTRAEIAQSDGYEVPAVVRVAVKLASGVQAWAYVDASHPPGEVDRDC